MSVQAEPYYQMDEVKENIDEEDNTPNENRLQNWGNQIDRDLDGQLMWFFDNDLTVFPLTEQAWIDAGFPAQKMKELQQLSTDGLEQKFWKETNGQIDGWKDWQTRKNRWIKNIVAIPATTEVAG